MVVFKKALVNIHCRNVTNIKFAEKAIANCKNSINDDDL